jgi:F-type H+-transporting ATPase subunit a
LYYRAADGFTSQLSILREVDMDSVFPTTFILFGLPVRDTVISTWVMVAIILIAVYFIRKRFPELLEYLIDFVASIVKHNIDTDNTERFIPFLGSLIIFITIANIIGIVPLIQTPTKDINTTLACALVVFFAVHIFGVMERGILGYMKKYATPLAILDIIGQVSRTISLTLRLFANIVAGEFIVAGIFMLVKPIAPLPLMLLGLITGVLQSYVFTALASSYISGVVRAK